MQKRDGKAEIKIYSLNLAYVVEPTNRFKKKKNLGDYLPSDKATMSVHA